MSGYPYHAESSFVRDPGRWAHDAFGHVGADDKFVRPYDVCFRTIPHTGTDISPKATSYEERVKTPVVAPVSGTIVLSGNDPEAGLFHIIKADGRNEWWIGGHHSRFEKRSGHVERGEVIARMGASGGAKGVHVHWSVATSLDAALAYIGGWVQYRSGRSVASWAGRAIRGRDQRMHGLIDPWPLIQREWADEERRRKASAKPETDPDEEQIMALSNETKKEIADIFDARAKQIESRFRREARPEPYFIQSDANGTYDVHTSPFAALVHPASGFIMPLNPSENGRRGQLDSLTTNYRIVAFDTQSNGFPERVFWNTLKDVARGAGIIDRDIDEAAGVAWAKSLFGIEG